YARSARHSVPFDCCLGTLQRPRQMMDVGATDVRTMRGVKTISLNEKVFDAAGDSMEDFLRFWSVSSFEVRRPRALSAAGAVADLVVRRNCGAHARVLVVQPE